MLKWSIMKPAQGWQEDDNVQISSSSSPLNSSVVNQTTNMIQQLIDDNKNLMIPCLLKVKSLMFNSSNNNSSSFSQPNLTDIQTIDNKNLIESIKNDDIWLILEKYYSSYLLATCLDLNSNATGKRFAIPFGFDGLFSLAIANKRTAKVYQTIKDLQSDIKKSYKIILLKSCVGYVIENKDNENINHEILLLNNNSNNNNKNKLNNNNNTKKQSNQYRIHKIDEGKILKFEKFCFIETTKCDLQYQNSALNSPRGTNSSPFSSKDNDENFFTIKTIDSNKILNGTSTTNTTNSSFGKKSLFTSLFSNLLNSSNNSSIRSSHKADLSDSIDKTDDANVNIYLSQKSIKSFTPTYVSSHTRRLKKSFELNINDNHDSSNNGSPTGTKTPGKIIRVAKCHDIDTNAIVYLRETCTGEFMIEASSILNTSSTSSPKTLLSPVYLYDIRTLVETNFSFDLEQYTSNNSIELELLMKRSTKFNRLPFNRICFNNNEIKTVRNQQTIIIYDVNKNKFLEYFLNDLLKLTKYYKFNKSINNDDLLNKYKAKLDWCMQTINEFKFDVKVKLNYLNNSTRLGFYLEQFMFRTYSRRNFQRRALNIASLPANNSHKDLHIAPDDNDDGYYDDDIESVRNDSNRSKRLSIDSNESDNVLKKEGKLKRMIKFATSHQSKNSELSEKQTTKNEVDLKYKRKLSEQIVNNNDKFESNISKSSGGNSTNYATVRNKLASIFFHATSNSSDINNIKHISQSTNSLSPTAVTSTSTSPNGIDDKNFITVINVNNLKTSTNNQNLNDLEEQHFKQPKKIFKRPTFLNSFTKQSNLSTSSSFDINESHHDVDMSNNKLSHHTSNVAINNNNQQQQQQQQQKNRNSSISRISNKEKEDNQNSSKRSIQNLLNITIRKKTPTNLSSNEEYLKTQNIEVTAI